MRKFLRSKKNAAYVLSDFNCGEPRWRLVRVGAYLFRLGLVHDTGSGCTQYIERVRLPVNPIRVMRSHFNAWESASKPGLPEGVVV
jgi:hypothetical protein